MDIIIGIIGAIVGGHHAGPRLFFQRRDGLHDSCRHSRGSNTHSLILRAEDTLMNFLNRISGILGQYANADPSKTSPDVHEHFDSVAQAVPKDTLAQGISAAFNSDQTPAFGQMVASLFGQSDPNQKAGVLNQLSTALGPGLVSQVLASKGLSALVSPGQVTPEAANQITPEAVEQLAAEAHKQNPSIVDTVSSFYAQHPTLVKTLGATALAVVMSKMSKRAA